MYLEKQLRKRQSTISVFFQKLILKVLWRFHGCFSRYLYVFFTCLQYL